MIDDAASASGNRTSRGGLAAFACLLAVLALIVAGACAWRVRQWNALQASQTARAKELESRLGAAERDAASTRAQQQAAQRQIDEMQNELRVARDSQNALDQRTRNVETAIGQISNQQFQGRDALLLDDVEFLLRAGQQRWSVLHDAAAAARAYGLADDTLAQVTDQAFQPVRPAIARERAALDAAAMPAREQASQALASLREQAAGLPAADSQAPAAPRGNGIMARIWRSLSGVLRVQRDDGAPAPAADADIARELLALDCAQAQASLLAFDDAGFRAAVQRADTLIAARFDADAPDVRAARSQLRALLGSRTQAPAPQLGGALAQLRALRASHAMQSVAPAPAASAGRP